jgi:hypothetical protein
MTADITFHYPPELFNLLVDAIPALNKSKNDVVIFFRGSCRSCSCTRVRREGAPPHDMRSRRCSVRSADASLSPKPGRPRISGALRPVDRGSALKLAIAASERAMLDSTPVDVKSATTASCLATKPSAASSACEFTYSSCRHERGPSERWEQLGNNCAQNTGENGGAGPTRKQDESLSARF